MQDYIEISTTPDLEDCVQVKSNSDYLPAMREEAYRYLAMLKKRFPFAGEVFRIKTCPHDFGSYLQIKILYEQGTKSESLAYFIENNLPSHWDSKEVFTMEDFEKYQASEISTFDSYSKQIPFDDFN